jgi:hypothetical protein
MLTGLRNVQQSANEVAWITEKYCKSKKFTNKETRLLLHLSTTVPQGTAA